MHRTQRMFAVLGLVTGLGLGLLGQEAAAQTTVDNPGILNGILNGGDGGRSRAHGGNSGPGGDGGVSVVHDVGTADADASNAVVIDEITTGDVDGQAIQVDARGATRPVVVSVAGSFVDTGVDVFAPGGNAQAGTTGGNSSGADSSGGDSEAGDGGEANARGGDGGRLPGSTTVTAPIS